MYQPIPILRLPEEKRAEWIRRACALTYPDYRDLDAWQEFRESSVRFAQESLPESIRHSLRCFFAPRGTPALVLENLPVDPVLPEIPADGVRPASKQAVSEAVITGLLAQWSELLSFLNEKGGRPIHEVTPVPGLEKTQSNAGRVRFGFHSDNAFLPVKFRQRGILLFGLKNRDTATTVLTAEQILEAAPPRLAHVLATPSFRHARPVSYANGSGAMWSPPGPILWRDEDGLARVVAASSSIEAIDAGAKWAVEAFRELLDSLHPARVVVTPGTALLFKDDRVLHGRDAVSGPRWLQRAYFTDSLRAHREATNSDPRAFAFDVQALV